MVLLLVGGGLGGRGSLTYDAEKALRECDIVYVDTYTSIWSDDLLVYVKNIVRKLVMADRKTLEDDASRIVNEARENVVGVLCPGDPLIATTHAALWELAARRNVQVKIVNGVSIVSASISVTGLHVYKFGKLATVPKSDNVDMHFQALVTLEENLSRGLHTLLLLDTASGGLTAAEAVEKLLHAAEQTGKKVISGDTLSIVIARLGSENASVKAGLAKDIVKLSLPPPPHSLIIPSSLHFTEREIVKTYAIGPEVLEKAVILNPFASRMHRYVEKCRNILNHVLQQKRFEQYVNYVKNYVDDAEKFMLSGDMVDSLLSIGYAEGLLDALRLMKEVDFKW
ncbi:MAG: diphthine synthase [Candidatus Caldarchaeum sp.]